MRKKKYFQIVRKIELPILICLSLQNAEEMIKGITIE